MPPGRVRDVKVYAQDALRLRVRFTVDGSAVDLSGSSWTSELSNGDAFTVDTQDAADGVVFLLLDEAQVAKLHPYTDWELKEHGLWDQTLLRGRLVRWEDV